MKRLSKLREDNGGAAVEFALLLPVFIMILFGILTFGFLFNSYVGITHAAREGVRWAALGGSLGEVQAKASAAAPQIDWSRGTVYMLGVSSSGATEANQGDPVTVRVNYMLPVFVVSFGTSLNQLGTIFGVPGGVFPTQLRAEATQRVE